jgi:hypothetical protein
MRKRDVRMSKPQRELLEAMLEGGPVGREFAKDTWLVTLGDGTEKRFTTSTVFALAGKDLVTVGPNSTAKITQKGRSLLEVLA